MKKLSNAIPTHTFTSNVHFLGNTRCPFPHVPGCPCATVEVWYRIQNYSTRVEVWIIPPNLSVRLAHRVDTQRRFSDLVFAALDELERRRQNA